MVMFTGYFGTSSRSQLYIEAMDSIRREAEKLDKCLGLCLVHSLAGGTGSGLGLRLVEEAGSDLSLPLRMCFTVAPHRYGDSPLQAYNSLFCLARLTQISDTIVLLHNDWLLEQLKTWHSSPNKPGEERTVLPETAIDLEQMNRLASDQMNNLLAPCRWPSLSNELADGDESLHEIHSQPLELSHSLTALPEARIIRCVSTPTERVSVSKTFSEKLQKSSEDWAFHLDLLQHTLRQCPIDATWNLNKPGRRTGCRPLNCLMALLVYRMNQNNTAPCTIDSSQSPSGNKAHHANGSKPRVRCDIRQLRDYLRPVSWNQEPIDQWFDKNGRTTRNSVTLAFNSCCITEDLNCLITRAHMRWKAGAYVHWFTRFGCTQDTFAAAFEQMKQVVDSYEQLAS
ncbi:hypothetical protein D915_002652 [Fasciola hepatica]|uniref:Tubulin delta chain n=1 Tax=Fasciola hepatica TaxID=6192 RepID=A0A4E0RCQ0_FASHE|nr:hypothetical protein D915_002652 [Fasciola hepatica]